MWFFFIIEYINIIEKKTFFIIKVCSKNNGIEEVFSKSYSIITYLLDFFKRYKKSEFQTSFTGFRFGAVRKSTNLADLKKSREMCLLSLSEASIQPRTSLEKLAQKYQKSAEWDTVPIPRRQNFCAQSSSADFQG